MILAGVFFYEMYGNQSEELICGNWTLKGQDKIHQEIE